MIKRVLFTLAGVVLAGLSSAAGVNLVCRLEPNMDPAIIAAKYNISLVDFTSGAPFALYFVAEENQGDIIGQLMVDNHDVVWFEDEADLVSPETEKGSTLPAVGDRSLLYKQNKGVLKQINFNAAVASTSGRTVKVAILDTGLSPFQPALWSKVDASINVVEPALPAYDIPQGQDSNLDGIPDNMTGHGTMIAGIIDQLSPQNHFVIARVANSDGFASSWTIIKGLAFAVTSGAEIANVSMGSLNQIAALSDVIDWCDTNHLVVVAAMGNNGLRTSCYPAKYSNTVSVCGLNPDNTKAIFSNWDGGCDAAGPATGIVSQFWDGSFANWSGTSFSTPMASAIAAEALRHTAGPISPSTIRNGFKKFGNDIDGINKPFKGEIGKLLDYTKFIRAYMQGTP
jgi:hypothetical protein